MRVTFVLALLVGLLGWGASAEAAVTATYMGVVVTVNGDAGPNELIVGNGATNRRLSVRVVGATAPDPDGAGTNCTASGDTIECAADYVRLNGGDGPDTLTDERSSVGDFFDTTLDGGPGADRLQGGPFQDNLIGGPGPDRIRGGSPPPGPPTGLGYQVVDTVTYAAATGPVTVTLDDQPGDGTAGEGDDIGSDIEEVIGSDFGDTLTAGTAPVQFDGHFGDDTLTGGPGDDRLNGGGNESFNGGGSGSDTLRGSGGDDDLYPGDNPVNSEPAPPRTPAGSDVLDGGDGRDYFNNDDGADQLIGGPGVDTVRQSRDAPRPAAPPAGYKAVPLGFAISLDGVANDGVIGANEGDDVRPDVEVVQTGDGPDTVTGSGGAESLQTAGGNDTIDAGGGADGVESGEGDDTIRVQDGITDRVDGGPGTDSAVADLPGGQPEKADVLLAVESVTGVPLPTVIDVLQLKGAPPIVTPPNTSPKVTVSGLTVTSKVFLKGVLSLKVSPSEPAAFTGELLAAGKLRAVGDLVVGTGKLALGSGRRTLRVTVGKSARASYKRRLRTKAQRKKGLSLRLRVVATDALGLPTTTTKTLKVKG